MTDADDLDDLVQGLASAKYALEAGELEAASAAIDATLARARHLITERAQGHTAPGELVRGRPAPPS